MLQKFFESYQLNPSAEEWSLLVTDSSKRVWYMPRPLIPGNVLTILADGTLGWETPTGGGGGSNTFTDTATVAFTVTGSNVTAAVKFPGLLSSDANNILVQGVDTKLYVNGGALSHNSVGSGAALIVSPGTTLSANRDFRTISASSALDKRGLAVNLSTATTEVEVSLPISTLPSLTPSTGSQLNALRFLVYDPSTTSNTTIAHSALLAATNGLRYDTTSMSVVRGSFSSSSANGSALTADTFNHLATFSDSWIGTAGATKPTLRLQSDNIVRFFNDSDANAVSSYAGKLDYTGSKTYFGFVSNISQLTQGTHSFNAGGTANSVAGASAFNGGGANNSTTGNRTATISGYYLTAPSFGMTAVGTANVDFTSQSTTTFVSTDLLFVVGNGAAVEGTTKSNAITVLKSGRTQINSDSAATKTQTEVTPKAALEVVSNNSGIIPPMLTTAQATALLSSLSTPSFTKRIIDPSGAANNRVNRVSADYNGDGTADPAGYYVDDREGAYFYNVETRTHQRIIWDPISSAYILQTF